MRNAPTAFEIAAQSGYLIGGVMKYIVKFKCWWFGHAPDFCCAMFTGEDFCERCHLGLSYDDLVSESRHKRAVEWLRWWLFRKWYPRKCLDCGHRFKCDDSVDHIPF